MTLASVQELLIQQQQKVQELAHELAAAKVLIPSPSPDPGLPCSGLRPGLLCPVHCIPWGPTLVFSHARYRARGPHRPLQRMEVATLFVSLPSRSGRSSSLPVALPREPTPTLWTWLGRTQDGLHQHVGSQGSRGSVPGAR